MSKSIINLETMEDALAVLRRFGIQPTPQRIAVVEYVLSAATHPSADEVLQAVRRKCPTVSRATVYNTLNLLAQKRLVRTQVLREGVTVFDPNLERHHHFVDDESGRVIDIPWKALRVIGQENLRGFEVREYQVIVRGRRRKAR